MSDRACEKRHLISDSTVIHSKAGPCTSVADRHIKFTLSPGTNSIYHFNRKGKVLVLQQM